MAGGCGGSGGDKCRQLYLNNNKIILKNTKKKEKKSESSVSLPASLNFRAQSYKKDYMRPSVQLPCPKKQP